MDINLIFCVDGPHTASFYFDLFYFLISRIVTRYGLLAWVIGYFVGECSARSGNASGGLGRWSNRQICATCQLSEGRRQKRSAGCTAVRIMCRYLNLFALLTLYY
ncbi:hypothetical protein ABFS83_05G032900 [Erythranthe nasuta]